MIIHTVTRPQESKKTWTGRVGRIDEELIKKVSHGTCRYYVCGAVLFVEAMTALLGSIGVPSDRVHFEKFPGYTA